MKILYRALIANDIPMECLGDEEQGLQVGDHVVLRCEKYQDDAVLKDVIGEPIADVEEFEQKRASRNKGRHVEGDRVPQILRKATAEDEAVIAENERQTVSVQAQTRDRIHAHGLEMKLIHTHYSFDRKLLLFQFSAEGRVDFRELLRDLSTLFRVRVELRQIGVRDEAAVLGGVGSCGRPFCCSQFLRSFSSINVRMAKQQGIALNPQNISGCCGRLKCCLAYEADYYRENPVMCRTAKNDEMGEAEAEAKFARDNVAQKNALRENGKPGRPGGNKAGNGGKSNRPHAGGRAKNGKGSGGSNNGNNGGKRAGHAAHAPQA